MKKLLMFTLLLVAVSCTVTALSAADGFSSSSTFNSMTLNNNDLTINGIHFTVPDGYEQVDNDKDDDELDADTPESEDIDGTVVDSKMETEFTNSAGDKIKYTVGIKANDAKIDKISPANFEQKNIAGKEGFLKKDSENGKDVYKFEYLEDGKLVKLEASSEDMINTMLA